MDVKVLQIPEVKLIRPKKHGDHRGFFSEVYNKKDYTQSEDIEGLGIKGYNARLVEEFNVHPNKIKELPIGQCYFLSKEKNMIIRDRIQVPIFENKL